MPYYINERAKKNKAFSIASTTDVDIFRISSLKDSRYQAIYFATESKIVDDTIDLLPKEKSFLKKALEFAKKNIIKK